MPFKQADKPTRTLSDDLRSIVTHSLGLYSDINYTPSLTVRRTQWISTCSLYA